MRSAVRTIVALASLAFMVAPSAAQTYSNCNPTQRSDCPPDSALGRTVNIDFTSESDSFTAQGSPTYNSDGVSFTVAKSGDSPQLTSKWYIMFGKVSVSLKAAPGAGIVSSFVMQSDTLDEIDWEWLGADPDQVQTNFFGKGQTTTYNRGAFHPDPGSQSGFKTYSIEWTSTQIVWQIDGVTVRVLEAKNADNQYPQTPMQIKVGAWSGGDSANAPGTIEWARGPTDYSAGPFTMQVKSLLVQDYSTGSQYVYGDQTGTWQSIKSVGGQVNQGGTPVEEAPPAITSTANGQPIPFTPTETSTFIRPSVYPWVPDSSTLASVPAPTYANYPGLPSGWTVSESGKVVPPSSAPKTSQPASPTPSSAASPLVSSGASSRAPSAAATTLASAMSSLQVITAYDQQGFTTIFTAPAGYTTLPKQWDSRGFEITQAPVPTLSAGANKLENNAVGSSSVAPVPTASSPSSSHRLLVNTSLVLLLAAFIGGVSIL